MTAGRSIATADAPLDALAAYLRLLSAIGAEPLRSALDRPRRHVVVQVFDSTGSTWAKVTLGEREIHVGPLDRGAARPERPGWVVSRRHLNDVLRRPELYAGAPARLDLGWLERP